MNRLVAAVVLASLAQVAVAQSMNAEAFYQRATALQKKGMMAVFSGGEIKALMHEGQAAGASARKQRQTALASGQKPRFCPPPGVVKINSEEFMNRLSAIPARERAHIDMTEATTRILAVKFPCRA